MMNMMQSHLSVQTKSTFVVVTSHDFGDEYQP